MSHKSRQVEDYALHLIAQGRGVTKRSKAALQQLLLALRADPLQAAEVVRVSKAAHDFVCGWIAASPAEHAIAFVAVVVSELATSSSSNNNTNSLLWQFLASAAARCPRITNLFLPSLPPSPRLAPH